MTLTLDEWAEQFPLLVSNLRVNVDIYCEDMPEEEKDQFMRMNLIVIRQWAGNKT